MMRRSGIVGILITIALATTAWATLTILSHAERISAVEVSVRDLGAWMERVDGKLDRLLER